MIIWWLWACTGPEPGGTAVGNPGDMDVAARVVDPEVGLGEVEVPTSHLILWACGGGVSVVPAQEVLIGHGTSLAPVEVPAGRWCGLDVVLAGPVSVNGTTGAGTLFTADLPIGAISLSGAVTVDGDALLLDLVLPVEAAAVDALGPEVELGPDDPLTLEWAAMAARDAVLVEDVARDGLVTELDPIVARAGLQDTAWAGAYQASEGCSCGTSAPPVGGFGALLVLAAWRRRRV